MLPRCCSLPIPIPSLSLTAALRPIVQLVSCSRTSTHHPNTENILQQRGTGKALEQGVLPSEHRPNPLGARASAQLWGHKDTPRPGHAEPPVCPRACPGAQQGPLGPEPGPLGPSRVPWSQAGSLGPEQGPLGRCSHQGQRAASCGCSSFSRAAHKCSTQGIAMALALGEDWSMEQDHLQLAGAGPRRAEPAPRGARGLRAQVLGTGSGALELTGCPAPAQQPLQPGALQGGSWAPREPLTTRPGCAPSTACDQSPAQLILHTERSPAP